MPGWSSSLPPLRNPLTGDPVLVSGPVDPSETEKDWFTSPLEFAVDSALKKRSSQTDPVFIELERLNVNPNTIFDWSAKRQFTDGGKIPENNMTHEEWDAWIIMRSRQVVDREGRNLYQQLRTIVDDPAYASASDDARKQKLSEIITANDNVARDNFLQSKAGARLQANIARHQEAVVQQIALPDYR